MLEGTIRKLWPAESDKFRDHLLRSIRRAAVYPLRTASPTSSSRSTRPAERAGRGGVRLLRELRVAAAAGAQEAGVPGEGGSGRLLGRGRIPGEGHCGRAPWGTSSAPHATAACRLICMNCLAENGSRCRRSPANTCRTPVRDRQVVGEIVPQDANYASLLAEAVRGSRRLHAGGARPPVQAQERRRRLGLPACRVSPLQPSGARGHRRSAHEQSPTSAAINLIPENWCFLATLALHCGGYLPQNWCFAVNRATNLPMVFLFDRFELLKREGLAMAKATATKTESSGEGEGPGAQAGCDEGEGLAANAGAARPARPA